MLKKRKNVLIIVLSLIIVIILSIYSIRKFSQTELDDVHPSIPCENELIQKSDILWVIPLFENISINEYGEWCIDIMGLNKTLGLHGVHHTYEEFNQNIGEGYLEKGIDEFEDCFGYRPLMFKPPQLTMSNKNKELLKNNGFISKGRFNQLFHKVYHCSDTGLFSNKVVSIF